MGRWKVPFLPMYRTRHVDFDLIYDQVFEPAISAIALPEGGSLRAVRADRDFYSAIISSEMFKYLEYSRLVLADISCINANVFYELGVRHRAREVGTLVFRQTEAPIPFDINQVRAFPYEYQPEHHAAKARSLISRVISESLNELRIDSPVQLALRAQERRGEAQPELSDLLRAAEDHIRAQDHTGAVTKLSQAVTLFGAGPLVKHKLATLYRERGEWARVIVEENEVLSALPTFSDAYRELGIAENKQYEEARKSDKPLDALSSGEANLRKAIELSPTDYDARSSLGGVLKRAGRLKEAFEMYRAATDIAHGHPYPLLNEIKTQAAAGLPLLLDDTRLEQLARAERIRAAQTDAEPPIDIPWSYFDRGEIAWYVGDAKKFLEMTTKGIRASTAAWQLRTHADSLRLLLVAEEGKQHDWSALRAGLDLLERGARVLPK